MSREQLDFLLEHSLDLLSIAGEDGYFLWLNDRWSELLGWTKEELYARPFFDLVHPDDLERTVDTTHDKAEHGDVRLFRNRYRHKDGTYRVLEWNAIGREGTFYCVTRDVTESEAFRQRALEQERLVLMAEELAGVGHWHVNLRTGELYWSEEIFRIHGLHRETFEPSVEKAVQRYHPDDRAVVEDALEKAIAERSRFEFELRIVRPDGAIRNVLAIGICLTDSRDEPVSLFGVFRDITEQHRLLTRMARSDRLSSLGTLAAGAAHEINNPLTWVMGTLDLIAERVRTLPEDARAEMSELLRSAIQGTERVAEIASGLKKFSRAEEGEIVELDVRAPLDEAIRMTRNQIRHRARLEVGYVDDIMVRGRHTDLVQVFTNLLVNAAQAIESGAADAHRIRVSVGELDANRVVVEVADDGRGMSDDTLERVFEPFFSSRADQLSTGLGLSICHGLVTSMGGEIEVDSAPGDGTRVRVMLPRARSGSATTVLPQGDESPSGRPTVLLIDDELALHAFVKRALDEARVVTAESGAEAVALLEQGLEADLIICDIMMPHMTGQEVHEVVLERWPHLAERIVFTTGGTFAGEVGAWVDQLERPILSKPFRLGDLRTVLSEHVRPT